MTYNNWANYPTWAIANQINNVEANLFDIQTIVRLSEDVYRAADNIEGFWTARIDLLNLTGAADDLMSYALNHVEWLEIAKSIAADMYEEDKFVSFSEWDAYLRNAE